MGTALLRHADNARLDSTDSPETHAHMNHYCHVDQGITNKALGHKTSGG